MAGTRTLIASAELPAVTISMRDDNTVSVIVPGTVVGSWVLAHHLAAECCRSNGYSTGFTHPVLRSERLCMSVRVEVANQRAGLELVQHLEGIVPKYARDELGMATHRTIVTPWSKR